MNEPKPPADVSGWPYLGWVVLSIGIVLVTMVTISCQERPRRGERLRCLSNLSQIIVSAHNHAATHQDQLPPQSQGPQELSWRVLLLPWIDQAALYRSYHGDNSWDDPENLEFAKTKISIYVCPDNPMPQDSLERYFTAYALLTGPGTAYDLDEPRRLMELPDGMTQTILFVEACGANIVWTEPRDVNVDRAQIEVNVKQESVRTTGGWQTRQHEDYVNVAFADGSTRSLSLKIDPEVRKALANPKPPE